jgi:hypothetical protein
MRSKHAPLNYIAISHVWSDGRGNDKRNALPSCQLRFLHSICELNPNLAIWMDTLCIPVRGKHEELRQQALKTMNETYLQATKVIVVSDDLLCMDFQSTFHHDAWLRVQTSTWMRRFWTLQEGSFASGDGIGNDNGRLFLRFKDSLVRFDSESLRLLLISRLSPAWTFNPKLCDIFTNIRSLSGRDRSGELVYKILQQFQWRDTSWEVDESVIMAGMLGLDPTPVSEFPWNDPRGGVDQRLERLYKRLDSFPTDVVYSTVPKLKTPGLRWAPQTLKIPDLVTHRHRLEPLDLLGIEKYGPAHSSRGRLLGEKYGKVHARGLDYWGHAVVFSVPTTEAVLPRSFRVLLDDSRCRGTCHTVPQLLLDVEMKNIAGDRWQDLSQVGSRPESAPVQIDLADLSKEADTEDKEATVTFALLIRCFGRHYAAQDGYECPAAIMRVKKGAKLYRSYCSNTLGNPLARRAREWVHWFDPTAQYLRGTYMMPTLVRSVPEHIREVWGSIQCPDCAPSIAKTLLDEGRVKNQTLAPGDSYATPVNLVAGSEVLNPSEDTTDDTPGPLSAKAKGKQPEVIAAPRSVLNGRRDHNDESQFDGNTAAAGKSHNHEISQEAGRPHLREVFKDFEGAPILKSSTTSASRVYSGYYYDNPFRIIID